MTQTAELTTHDATLEWNVLKQKDKQKAIRLEDFMQRVAEESATNLGDKVEVDE
jgi:hypothetical protein